MHLHYLLINFSEAHRIISYLAVFFGMFIEGEMILILAGILIRNGNLDFIDTFLIASAAVFFHDIGWWTLGKIIYKSGRKKILFLDLEKAVNFLHNKNKSGIYIFISKFTWALNRFVLLSSGYLKTSFETLIGYSLPANLIWTLTFISIGYFFANQTALLRKDIKTALIFISVLFLIIIASENIFQRILRRLGKEDID